MNVSMKTMIPTAMLALSAMTLSSCGSKTNSNINKNTINKMELAPYDSTKANLPVIDGDKVTYRNTDGDVISISISSEAYKNRMTSLYKAIIKFSAKENPNITEPEKFYTEVEKNIPKNFNAGSTVYQEQIYSQYGLHSSILLENLYNKFTAPDSEQGKTITVNEYTQMMDAWSSTGIRE